MDGYADIPSRPYTFRGALAFNQRTVSGAVASLLGDATAAEQKPISLAELANVLLLLESIATSSGMYLDGTLPPADLQDVDEALWRVRARSGVAIDIDFLKPSADTLVSMFKASADAAALLMQQSLEHLEDQSDVPIKGDVSKFVAGLQTAGQSNAADDMARGLADSAARGIETFRGSKCLAGLILADSVPVPLLELAVKTIVGATDAAQRKAIAVLINRFRINYVNSLATLREAAYLADGTIEDLKSAQVVLFSRYVAKKIAQVHAAELSAATQNLFDRSLSGVPLGFAILMNSRGKSALELVEEAVRIRDSKFAAAAAAETPQSRFLHQLNEGEFSDFRDYLFLSRWTDLMNASERAEIENCPWRTLRIPGAVGSAIAAVAGALLAGPAGAAAGAALGSVVGSLAQFAGEELGRSTLENRPVHTDQYRKMDKYFALAAKNDRFAQALSVRVEALFNRPLDAGATL